MGTVIPSVSGERGVVFVRTSIGLLIKSNQTRKASGLRGRFDREFRSTMNRMLIPEDVISLCHRAMRYDADKRYKTAGKMAKEIRACLRSLGPSQRLAHASSMDDEDLDITDSRSDYE